MFCERSLLVRDFNVKARRQSRKPAFLADDEEGGAAQGEAAAAEGAPGPPPPSVGANDEGRADTPLNVLQMLQTGVC